MKPLIDSYSRTHTYLRISVTDRCNLRCRYCMPPDGIALIKKEMILSYEEILRLVRLFARLGVNKVRITGGEPLVRKNLPQLVAQISAVPGIETIGMTTNAVLLADHVDELKQAGLSKLNISLDSLRRERFEEMTLRRDFDKVLGGINAALDAGFAPLKLNVVVLGGVNDDEMLDFVRFAEDKPINVRFIEFMPFDGNRWQPERLVGYRQMREIIESRYKLKPLSHGPNEVAKDFEVERIQGSVSFITSMTDDFCGTCNRLRLTAEGELKTCLFHQPQQNLRDLLRNGASDAELEATIRGAVLQKPAGHAPMDELMRLPNRSMISIGG